MSVNGKDQKLFTLFLPIFAETFLLMLSGMVDTLMLSSVSDEAVGAVGTSNSYLGIFFILFAIISSGLIAVMTQYIGAGKKGIAYQARRLALILNGALGLVLSLLLGFLAEYIINWLGVAAALRTYAITYLRIVGAGCLLNAVTPVFSSYLRAFDKTKFSLIAALTGNAVNLILNALFIFVWHLDVTGVAIATIIGKVVTLGMCIVFGHVLIQGRQYEERMEPKKLLKQIIRIGLPAAAESAFYSASMAVVTAFLNQMDKAGFNATARTYASQITNFGYCAAVAFAQANVIINGWRIGEGKLKECYPSTNKAGLFGIAVGIGVELLLASFSVLYMPLFTKDASMVNVVQIVLFIDVALEVGRATNLVYGMALKSAGDSVFPSYVAVIFNALCAIGATYLFGIVLGLGVVGAYIGLTMDECFRAVFLFVRYQKGKWESKVLIKEESRE